MTTLITVIVAFAAIWPLLCRIAAMLEGRARPLAFVQHATLAMTLFIAAATALDWDALKAQGASGWVVDILAEPRVGVVVLSFGVLVYLWLGGVQRRRTAARDRVGIIERGGAHNMRLTK